MYMNDVRFIKTLFMLFFTQNCYEIHQRSKKKSKTFVTLNNVFVLK